MRRISSFFLLAAFVAALAPAGCGEKKKGAPAATPASEAEAGEPVPAATGVAAEIPGKALLETRCTVCHNLERVQKKKLDFAGWEETVNRMTQHGAKLNEAEQEAVLSYVAETYGK